MKQATHKPQPTSERLKDFREFVRIYWDGENLADMFRDYEEEYEPLHPDQMKVLTDELAFRRVMAE